MPRKLSSEWIRQRLWELFDRETAGLDSRPELTFTWDMNGRAAVIRRLSPQRMRVEINLRVFRRTETLSEQALEFCLCRCVCCVTEGMRLWESAAVSRPRSYLQGLAYIEVLQRMESGCGDLFVPLWGDAFPGKFTAADLFCAAAGSRHALERYGHLLSPEELALQRQMPERLNALAEVPEVVRRGRKLPESSMVRCIRTAGALLKRRPEYARSVPVLRAMSDGEGQLCTFSRLLACCGETEDPFCCGVALRLFAFADGDPGPLLSDRPEIRRGLEEAARAYAEHSVNFARVCGRSAETVVRDNLLALERMSAALGRRMERYGMSGRTGVIHPLSRV